MIAIPLNIEKRIRKERAMRLFVCLILVCLLIVAFLFLPALSDLEQTNKLLTVSICCVVILLFTGVPFKLLGKSWQGEIIKVEVKTATDSDFTILPTRETQYTANRVVLTVKTTNGKLIRKVASKNNAKHSQSTIDAYEVGDYVVHISGAKHTAVLKKNPKQLRCVMCGLNSPSTAKNCTACGSSLLSYSDSNEDHEN